MTAALAALVLLAAPVKGGIPEARIVLYVLPPAIPGRVWEEAPPRFVLMEDRTVFVGGTSDLATAPLEKRDVKPIEKLADRVRKLRGLRSPATLGPGETRYRLILGKEAELDAQGDPAAAPAGLEPLANLIEMLAGFEHPALRPYRPAQYALTSRLGELPGGCRAWGFSLPPSDPAPRAVPAAAAADWPQGALAASVCVGGARYVVTLRPLLPGERP